MKIASLLSVATGLFLLGAAAQAEVKVTTDTNTGADATAAFKFKNVPTIGKNDLAAQVTFSLIDGRQDFNGGEIEVLNDAAGPKNSDDPEANFFLAGQAGGRLLANLGGPAIIDRISTYSWHKDVRAPQVYTVYASDGSDKTFNAHPRLGTDPATCGWKKIAVVDTRPKEGEPGGQVGVSIADAAGTVGTYSYVLFDIAPTDKDSPDGNTFYSEIEIVGKSLAPATQVAGTQKKPAVQMVTIDTSNVPELKDWVDTKLQPKMEEWYPKIVAMLPSDGFTAPKKMSLIFRDDMDPGTPAATAGTHIMANIQWFKKNLDGEAVGCIIHEMVHVVQQSPGSSRGDPHANPGWLIEGVADYVRWFKFEPQAKRPHPTAAQAKYNGSYRITAAFLQWATEKYDKDLVQQLSADMRNHKYDEALWKKYTGKTVQELGDEWKQSLEKPATPPATQPAPKP